MATICKTDVWKEYFSRLNPLGHPLRRKDPQRQPATRPAAGEKTLPSVLAAGTVVSGSVRTETDLAVWGRVNGDISSQRKIEVVGEVRGEVVGEVVGEVTGRNIRILGGHVQGNIRSGAHCRILQGTLEGDLDADYGEIDGGVEGNVSIRETLNLHRSSVIRGDIAMRILQIGEEAKLSGRIQMEFSCADPVAESSPA